MSILFLIDARSIGVMNAGMDCFKNKEDLEYKKKEKPINWDGSPGYRAGK